MGLSTLAGNVPQGFFIPYRHAATVRPIDYQALLPYFRRSTPHFRNVLAMIADFQPELAAICGPAPQPRFDQDWYTGLDACAAYAFVAGRRPKRIVEVGSGHSTRFMARAVADFAMDCRIVCIDPHPRASIEALGVELNRSVLEDAPSHLFDDLAAGDILFVDSSHIAMPGGDVDRLFNDILPRLPRDVLVHVHDIFLPGRYPKQWEWRGYNEQLVVAALIHGSGYEILFSSQYIRRQADNLSVPAFIDRLPVPQTAIETGLWLKKSCAPAA